MKIYRQTYTARKWSVTTPSRAMQILHKVTLGKFGAIPMVELTETDMVLMCIGAPQIDLPKFGGNHKIPERPFLINCRCSS